jgi:short-subunit dehydrogenase
MSRHKQALVTGASSGIGLAITRQLLAQDYQVTGISRRAQIPGLADHNFHSLGLDLGDLGRVESQLADLLRTRQFDCFVHAAGRGDFGSIEQFSRLQIEESIRVNLLSGMLICRALVPSMRRQRHGRIVFIGSESALQAGRKGALYSAAKFGLRGFSQALREDCAADGIQVSLVNPGMVRSPFFDELAFAPGALAENAIDVDDVAAVVIQILQSSADIVIDEVNLTPRVKSLDFTRKP